MEKSSRSILFLSLLIGSETFGAGDPRKNDASVNCSSKGTSSAECNNFKRSPSTKKENLPALTRKPPKAPKQISPVMDELPERREDDF